MTLTPRQREVCGLLATGRHTKDIAFRLGVSPKTIEYHRKSLYLAIGAISPADLLVKIMHREAREKLDSIECWLNKSLENVKSARDEAKKRGYEQQRLMLCGKAKAYLDVLSFIKDKWKA